jgi:hypothetical protein
MSDDTDGVWRDERTLPLSELDRAMATSAGEGQTDDTSGGDAGAEAAFGHGASVDGEPAERPSPTGRTGPA